MWVMDLKRGVQPYRDNEEGDGEGGSWGVNPSIYMNLEIRLKSKKGAKEVTGKGIYSKHNGTGSTRQPNRFWSFGVTSEL